MKKKKKLLRCGEKKSDDQESILIDPKTSTDQQNSLDQPKKKKKSKSERVQTENEEIPKKKNKKRVDALCDIESSLKINRQVWRGETVLTEMHVNKNLESAPTTLRKSKKRKRATSCQSDDRESVSFKSKTTAADENVLTEIKERVTLPSSKKRQPGSHERRRKKKRTTDKEVLVEEAERVTFPLSERNGPKKKKETNGQLESEELRPVNGSILQGSDKHLEELTDFTKKKKKTKQNKELNENANAGRGESVLTERQMNEPVSNDDNLKVKKRKRKKKRKQSVESIDQESINVEPQTTDQDLLIEENGLLKKKIVPSGQTEDEEELSTVNGLLGEITKKKKKKKKKKTTHATQDNSDQLNSQSEDNSVSKYSPNEASQDFELDAIDGETSEDITKKQKKKKKKKKKMATHATQDNSDQLNLKDNDNSVSEYSRNVASQGSESEATDGESSSSDLTCDSDLEDFQKLDVSSVPWLVKSQRGFFEREPIEEPPVLHMRNHYFKKGRETLRYQGHTVKEGRWNGLEEARMRENLEKFCKAYGIEDFLVLLFPSRFGLAHEVQQFWKTTKMLVKLAEGIHRTLCTVYLRAVKIFDPWHYLGSFSEGELKEMVRLEKKYGHKWQYIGDRLHRSNYSVKQRMKYLKKAKRKGKWLKFELKQLYDAVMEITAPFEGRIDRFVGVPWKKVAEAVPTRTAEKCYGKWNSSLGWRFNERKKHTWQANDYIELLELVDASNVREEFEIDWLSISEKFSDRVCTRMQLKTLWHRLKVKFAPNHYFMEYCDILDTLFEKALPALKVADAEHEKVMAKRAAKQLEKNSKVYIISDSEMSDEDSAVDWM